MLLNTSPISELSDHNDIAADLFSTTSVSVSLRSIRHINLVHINLAHLSLIMDNPIDTSAVIR